MIVEAVIDIATPELMANSHIIYIAKGTDFKARLNGLNPGILHVSPSYAAALPHIRRVLMVFSST